MGSIVCRYTSAAMKILLFLLTALVANSLAAQTCLQGWRLHEMHHHEETRCHCYWFADRHTRVSHQDATDICAGKGGWLAEIDDSNWWHVDDAWIVDQLMDIQGTTNDAKGPHWEDQWWIGALSQVSDKVFKVPISVILC